MHHCVGHGSYDEGLRSGAIEIYSMHDPVGQPVVTMEIMVEETMIGPDWVLSDKARTVRYVNRCMGDGMTIRSRAISTSCVRSSSRAAGKTISRSSRHRRPQARSRKRGHSPALDVGGGAPDCGSAPCGCIVGFCAGRAYGPTGQPTGASVPVQAPWDGYMPPDGEGWWHE